jgi:hypothetical protein
MKKNLIAIIVLLASMKSFGQNSDTTKTSPWPIITGSVDVYYRYNFANAKNPETVKLLLIIIHRLQILKMLLSWGWQV